MDAFLHVSFIRVIQSILSQLKSFLMSLNVNSHVLTVFSCLHRGASGHEGNRRWTGLADMARRQAWGEYRSVFSSSSHLEFAFRINLHGGNTQEGPGLSRAKYLTIWLVWLAFRWASCVYMSGCYKIWQLEPNGCLSMDMRWSSYQGAERACLGCTRA